jgi:serine/threonine protein kinase
MPWQVPGYRPREDLAGGSGRVVLAVEESSGRLVIIKYLNTDSSYTSDELRSAVQEISELPDHYFVRIRELVQDSGRNAIVMDPLTGTTMRALIRDDGPFEPESALVVFRDILTGLTYAHALDIVHGEVTPENAMVGTDGRPVLLNAGAATWDRREPTLSSGVYLAPERWNGGPPSAATDVYAATVSLVESLVGEPPYWEDTDLDRLRRRHASEDIDVSHVPAALHDVVRAGMAKSADARLAAAALLDLVETAAIAGYGHHWSDRGRDDVVQLVRARVPGVAWATDANVRDAEDVANDDYYAEASAADADSAPTEPPASDKSSSEPPSSEESSTEPSSRDAAADAVMAAAAEIVAFAQLRDAAEADAIRAASVDEELTEEEESAVAEIERLLFLDEPVLDEPTPTSDTSDPAVGDNTAANVPAEAVTGGAAESSTDADADADEPTLVEPADPTLAEPPSSVTEAATAEAVAAAASPDELAAAAESAPAHGLTAATESVPADRAPADAETVAPSPGSSRVPTQPASGVEREPVAPDPDRPVAGSDSESGSDRVPAQATSAEALAAAEVAAAAAADPAAAASARAGEPVATRSATGSGLAAEDGARPSDAASAEDGAPPVGPGLEPAGTSSGSGGGRRPWWFALGAVAAVVVVAGLLVWAGVGRTDSNSRTAAGASSRPTAASSAATPTTGQPSASVPASAGGPPIGATPTSPPISPSATTSSPGAAPPSGTAPSAGASGTSATGPTLPLTGFEHPIRLMAAVAAVFVFLGAFLLYAGRRRDGPGVDDL